jgi:hypothetical protein
VNFMEIEYKDIALIYLTKAVDHWSSVLKMVMKL